MKDHKDAWIELKSRLENFLWELEQDGKNNERASDVKYILKKMNDFEKQLQ